MYPPRVTFATIFAAAFLAATPLVSGTGATPAKAVVSIGPATDVPLDVGVRLSIEGPRRVRLSTSVGILPDPYLDIINAAAVEAGAYDEETAKIVERSLRSSLVWRTHVGWRAWRGLYVGAGYGLVGLGGSVAGEDLFTVATGTPPPAGEIGGNRKYSVKSMIHMADVEVGWEWRIRSFAVRSAVGFAYTFDARTEVEPEYRPLFPQVVERYEREMEAYLDSIYESYVHSPVLTISAGWTF